MRFLITAGPTREPIDAVRFVSNRSSGQMGTALISAALAERHEVTAILGPIACQLPASARRLDVETTREMHDAVMKELPLHDVLIMAAAVADYRPAELITSKMERGSGVTLQLEPTEDIVAAAALAKRPDQRIIGFSLEKEGDLDRARQKLVRKRLDMIVFNPLRTMNAQTVQATLVYPDRQEPLGELTKEAFAEALIARILAMAK